MSKRRDPMAKIVLNAVYPASPHMPSLPLHDPELAAKITADAQRAMRELSPIERMAVMGRLAYERNR